ncbi:MAG: prepilin peptidase [Deltaproteobacteria bacterium]|nr:prepilin peptidase [Deltaproteobacteria bacterium]
MEQLHELIPAWQFIAFAAVFGSFWGSFANVVIARWPLEQSVWRPASHCMSCKEPIRFYDNVPIISYFVLRGRCRHCKASYSPRYAIVEAAMALLSVGVLELTLLADPPSFQQGAAEYFIWFAFVWALVTAGIIDLETYLIPDAITYPGVVAGIAANAFVLELGWLEPLIAMAAGYLVIRLLFIDGYKLLTGRAGMGDGDAKLVAVFGAFLGVEGALFALFAGAIQGLVVGTIMVVVRRKDGADSEPVFEEDDPAEANDDRFRKARVPFGPFLALGAIEYFFVGRWLLDAYTGGVLSIFGLD